LNGGPGKVQFVRNALGRPFLRNQLYHAWQQLLMPTLNIQLTQSIALADVTPYDPGDLAFGHAKSLGDLRERMPLVAHIAHTGNHVGARRS
jgi:hypothetical protein